MNMTDSDGVTRFERAKDEIRDIIDEAKEGSVFSLVVVRDTTEVVFEHSDDRERIYEQIDSLSCSDGSVDFVNAIGVAQGYFDENPSLVTYLVTDTEYLEYKNVIHINVASGENNISLEDVSFTVNESAVTVFGNVISYGADRMVDVEVYDDATDMLVSSTKLQATADKLVPFTLSFNLESFYSLTVKIPTEDAMALDLLRGREVLGAEHLFGVALALQTDGEGSQVIEHHAAAVEQGLDDEGLDGGQHGHGIALGHGGGE